METLSKTMHGMSATFGTLAAALHLPAAMRCCGVTAVEAQIAAYHETSSTNEELSDAIACTIRSTGKHADKTTKQAEQMAGGGMKTVIKSPASSKAGGQENGSVEESESSPGGIKRTGVFGMLSAARSVDWRRRWGAKDKGEDDQSQTSQISALSFLSGGLKLLASKGLKTPKWFQWKSGPRERRAGDHHPSDEISEMSLFDEYNDDGRFNERKKPTPGALRWRHVRMLVRRVRGEGPGLAGTVRYRSARRIQVIFRQGLARKEVARRLVAANAARRAGNELRMQRRRREVEAKNGYKEVCRAEGRRLLEWCVKCFLQPRAAVDLQRVWRGYRARKRLAAYLKWLDDRARRKREYERYMAALAASRASGDAFSDQVKRRVWGRVEFAHTGWKPRYEVENPPSMHDHVWVPPKGSSSGVRTRKVILPPRSERDRQTLTDDMNAWAGIPIGVAKCRPPKEKLGVPPRPGTIGAERNLRRTDGVVDNGNIASREMRTVYNWLPAPLVAKVGLLQTPLKDR